MFCRFAFISLLLIFTGCKSAPPQVSSVRLACDDSSQSLDPRSARSLIDASLLNCFFEGLMRVNSEGKLVSGMAESYSISEDGLVYTFRLRKANWSNGDPVTSTDFAYSWRSILSHDFPAPNAFQLYPIQNARRVKEAALPVDTLGIQTPDETTLIVTLEKPTPYFLELTSLFTLFPVNHRNTETFNGPFARKKQTGKGEMVGERNPYYWDKEAVRLDEVHFVSLTNEPL